MNLFYIISNLHRKTQSLIQCILLPHVQINAVTLKDFHLFCHRFTLSVWLAGYTGHSWFVCYLKVQQISIFLLNNLLFCCEMSNDQQAGFINQKKLYTRQEMKSVFMMSPFVSCVWLKTYSHTSCAHVQVTIVHVAEWIYSFKDQWTQSSCFLVRSYHRLFLRLFLKITDQNSGFLIYQIITVIR